MMHMMNFGWSGIFGMSLMMILHLALAGLILYGAVYFGVRKGMESRSTRALEILQIRLAQGEIDEETYQKIKKEIA